MCTPRDGIVLVVFMVLKTSGITRIVSFQSIFSEFSFFLWCFSHHNRFVHYF